MAFAKGLDLDFLIVDHEHVAVNRDRTRRAMELLSHDLRWDVARAAADDLREILLQLQAVQNLALARTYLLLNIIEVCSGQTMGGVVRRDMLAAVYAGDGAWWLEARRAEVAKGMTLGTLLKERT